MDKAEIKRRLLVAAALKPQPELHLRAEKTTQYQVPAEVMAQASKVGLKKIGFVSDPQTQQP